MKKTLIKGTVTVVAGASLLLGAAACDDAKDTADNAANSAGDAKDKAGDAANDAKDQAGDAADDAKNKAGDAKDKAGAAATDAKEKAGDMAGGTVDAKTADGKDVKLPKDVQTAWDNAGGESGEWGKLVSVDEGEDGKVLATFENDNWVAYSKDHSSVPLNGMIGRTWVEQGGLENPIGLPTAPEKGSAQEGWTQSFENGNLAWTKDDAGNWTASTQPREGGDDAAADATN
ncbi:hypothetical protein QP948_03775 [Corynebacterium bovis]|uniref:LGFP repeat-containing protein n=1 Tax=Corynebacterium bovis TaxID=36808 RepID=UPI00254C8A79|nr:hypothetical protein [Corynebacterium bovis]MDK8510529.1 hypothetical protein [Corynebacterium bovis]